jgi:arylsulfatase A-like enzyme
MCAPTRGQSFPDPLKSAAISRRRLLTVTGAAGASYLFSGALSGVAQAAEQPKGKKRVYVIVVDGCRPGEIRRETTPRLEDLRVTGRQFPNARSLPIMETIPNHTMMMTGARPDRTGVPANEIYDAALGDIRTMDQPSDLRFPTVIERLNNAGFTTGTVLSKTYLYGIFGERATYQWEPGPIIPISEHAPDVFTIDAAIAMVEEFDPNFVFINLGDVDRMGHSDFTGTDFRAARRVALADTDIQVGRFIDLLKDSGRWENSVVIVLADHSMDWSRPQSIINLNSQFEGDEQLAGNYVIADNGGADLLYWTGPEEGREAGVARMRELALATQGVLSVHRPAKLRLGPEAGDLVVYCEAGWRFSDPSFEDNPIPGNHGHPATKPIPFIISGGSPLVRKNSTSAVQARTVDVAPTVGAVFGLGAPRAGYDGRKLI